MAEEEVRMFREVKGRQKGRINDYLAQFATFETNIPRI